MSSQKKQSFLGGAAILAAAVAVVKVIGAFYKFPLNNILGGEGKTYFDTAYRIYNFLLTFSTAGLPLAISKLTSQAHAQGRENEKRKIFRVSLVLFLCLGTVGSLFMFFQADGLAGFLENSLAAQPIRALAPAVFCVCLLACMRGYTQGQGNMTPTAVSQVLEALLKLAVGLPLAWYVLYIGMSLDMGAAGAILGVTMGTAVSLLFLTGYLATHRNRTEALDVPSGSGQLIRQILAFGIPITLSNSAMSIINIIDTKIVMGQLQNALLLSEPDAALLNGQYSMAMDMPNMVASFVYPVTMSLIPFAAAALARQDNAGADRIISSAFRIIAILALPAGVGLSALATPIMVLVLPTQREDALAAGPHLYPGGRSGHQHPRRPHLHPVLLSGDRGAEPVLRVEILASEAPVSPGLRKAGGRLSAHGRRGLGGLWPGSPLPAGRQRLSVQRHLHIAWHLRRRGSLRRAGHRPADPAGGGCPLHPPRGKAY